MVALSTPDLSGMTEYEASAVLKDKNLSYRRVGEGATITGQIPAAGSTIPGLSEMVLYFGAEVPVDLVTVPDFTDWSLYDANILASNNGLYLLVAGVNRGADERIYNVRASHQDIAAGTQVPRGTTITVEFTDYDTAGEG